LQGLGRALKLNFAKSETDNELVGTILISSDHMALFVEMGLQNFDFATFQYSAVAVAEVNVKVVFVQTSVPKYNQRKYI
jgi:hypothetical protein